MTDTERKYNILCKSCGNLIKTNKYILIECPWCDSVLEYRIATKQDLGYYYKSVVLLDLIVGEENKNVN